jgi:LAO/AO transport system kinase
MADRGLRPAILAVDPSSPISGGAILGDRIRDSAAAELGLFFRSIASRGSLGGLSRTLDDVVTLLDAAGFDGVLIETVGTGQSEVAITRLADTTLAVTAPGLGDEVQAMKAGILEVADIVVVNKLDADAVGAETAADTIRTVLSLGGRAHGLQEGANFSGEGEALGWLAPVRAVSALNGKGLDELLDLILAHRAFLERSRLAAKRRAERRSTRFREALHDALLVEIAKARGGEFTAMESAVAAGERDPISAARELARTIVGAHAPGVPSANRGAA